LQCQADHEEALTLGLRGYAAGALLISQTYHYFPRRVVVTAFDQAVLLAIVVVICIVASLVGIWKALRVDPATALGGGARRPRSASTGTPLTHGGVVGQVWRGGTGRQAPLARLLPGIEVAALDATLGR
jgi:hypothetical protein